jgi:hypothetical protein
MVLWFFSPPFRLHLNSYPWRLVNLSLWQNNNDPSNRDSLLCLDSFHSFVLFILNLTLLFLQFLWVMCIKGFWLTFPRTWMARWTFSYYGNDRSSFWIIRKTDASVILYFSSRCKKNTLFLFGPRATSQSSKSPMDGKVLAALVTKILF